MSEPQESAQESIRETELIVPLCFAVPGRGRNVIVAGNLRFRPRRCPIAGSRPALVVEGRDGSRAYFAHAGALWRKAIPRKDLFPTGQGLTLRSESLGIPFDRPDFADFDFTRPPPGASRIAGWRDEVDRIARRLADDIVAGGGDVYIRCAPRILVRWPRQPTSKPTLAFAENGAAEDPEVTCFSPARLQAARSFVAANREVPDRFPLRIEMPCPLETTEDDDVAAFVVGTRAWLTARLDDPNPATALLRHGYGLLPPEVLDDLETVRDPQETGRERIMQAVLGIRSALSDAAIADYGEALAAAGADGEAVGRARHLGRRIALMTRLAMRRWEFERGLLSESGELDPDDCAALETLAGGV